MGPEDRGAPVKVYMMVDAEPVEVATNYAEITYAEEQTYCEPLTMQELEFTVRIEQKDLRCRNRKRFVKRLMANGYSRNEAQKAASYIVRARRRGKWEHFTKSYQRYFIGLWNHGVIRI